MFKTRDGLPFCRKCMAEKELREVLQHRYPMLMGVLHLTKNSGCNFWDFAVANRKL